MRTPYAIGLLVTMLLGGTYWFAHVEAECRLPLTYRIGHIDDRFGLSKEEARLALMEAEAVWENATGKNLFTYDEDAKFTVNFVFDERQALADAERNLRDRLDETESESEAIDQTYAELVAKYNELTIEYQDAVAVYERALHAYNAEVEAYNDQGGAPESEYERLTNEKDRLDREQQSINELAAHLHTLVAEINRIGEEGNRLVDIHNREVERYNETFAESREFTQGDYYRTTITIYTWSDRTELKLVLAHELGHALSLDHVENEDSIMYYLMGGQTGDLEPTEEDLAAFERVCGEGRSVVDAWKAKMGAWFGVLIVHIPCQPALGV